MGTRVVSEQGVGLMETLRLKCPDCSVEFDFSPPALRYLQPGIKGDYAPARCPKGHVHMYNITTGKSKP
jgi:hypothetical protein